MKLKQTLDNPFMLVAEGFVAGAILFFLVAPGENPPGRPDRAPSAVSATLDA
jgi:hypothetical protein